jgi:arginine-tRNA-protein transferase
MATAGSSSSDANANSNVNINRNVVRPCGYSSSECGYCKGSKSEAYGVLVDLMTCETYEQFLYRGWRRSGIHLYKPSNFKSCCPALTIRLPVSKFQATKSQQKVLKKMEHLLKRPTTTCPTKAAANHKASSASAAEQHVSNSGVLEKLKELTEQALPEILPETFKSSTSTSAFSVRYKIRPAAKMKSSQGPMEQLIVIATTTICAQIAGNHKTMDRGDLARKLQEALLSKHDMDMDAKTTSLPKEGGVTIEKIDRHEMSGQVLVFLKVDKKHMAASAQAVQDDAAEAQSMSMQETETPPDKLAQWYEETLQKPLIETDREITITTLPAHESALDPAVHKLYVHYQHVVHKDPDAFAPSTSDSDDDPSTSLMPSISDLEWGNAPSDWNQRVEPMLSLYLKDYPESLHDSIVSNYYSFYQFLVESPFPLENKNTNTNNNNNNNNNNGHKVGTVHQHYKLGDLLIAVGVVDVLPNGISSVYLIYHPTFSHQLVALGKYAILKEVEYTRKLQLPYYYLGYYIQSCPKMRYKAEYQPSELLCPKFFQWVDATQAMQKLQQTPTNICALVNGGDESASSEPPQQEQLVKQVLMDIGAGMNVTIDMLHANGQQVVRPFLEEFVKEAGPELCRKCLVKLG